MKVKGGVVGSITSKRSSAASIRCIGDHRLQNLRDSLEGKFKIRSGMGNLFLLIL